MTDQRIGDRIRVPITRSTLVPEVRDAIESLIMDGVIPPGTRVGMEALARELGTSPTPIREALASLESAGLVVKESLKGYSTTPLMTRAEVEDMFRFRLLIEPWAAETAARADPEQTAPLTTEVASALAAAGDGEANYRDIARHDARFHDMITELAGSDHVRQALARTHCHLHLFRLSYGPVMAAPTFAEHRRIAESIAEGRPDLAKAAMVDHLTTARDRILKSMSSDPRT
ncbi:GntR family transcriptional regulator [Nonomuraea sediminis]|uniref:GntR family transcriptional regulator n=1 Tax=Nonomuraea sediminis TaxID=2835864 RepID=UPI001BDC1242|nr:GntR family transcriptional regulator [Nonomuraea sediminis]